MNRSDPKLLPQLGNTAPSCIVQLVQINQPFMQKNYLPYAAGLLQAYVMRHASAPWRYTFLPPLFAREPIEQALAKLALAQVVGFSAYAWNWRYTLELARRLKAARPQTLIVFGGPQVPDRAENFLRQHPFVDVAVHGEGEKVLLELLEAWPDWQSEAANVPGISFISPDGNFVSRARPARIQDLDDIPSPYLSGLYEPLLRAHPGEQWLALWESNRGCPFSCSFCDWGSATAAKVTRFGLKRLLAEVEWFGRMGIHTIYSCDANYGMLKRDLEITEKMVMTHERSGYPKVFYIQNTKNVTERAYQIQKMISQAGLNNAVTLSLQSTTPEVLKNIQRENISLDSYRELQNRFRADGIATYTDILVGLPGETYASFASSLSRVIDEGQHHLIRFYNVSLLPNAEMAQPEYRARHGLETVEILHVEPLAPTRIDIPETQEIVIATRCLSKPDWVRMRVMAWWAELVYFNRKLLQVPIALLNLAGVPYADTFCYLVDGNWPQTQIMSQIRQFLCHKARAIQQGDSELCAAQIPGQRDMWLTVEEHLVTGLCQTLAWNAFFDDAKVIFDELLLRQGKTLPPHVLEEALTLSSCLLQGIILEKPFDLPVSSNFWQVYQGVLSGHPLTLAPWQGRLSRNWAGHPYHQLKLIHETDLAGQSPPGTPSGAKMTGA